MTPAWTIRLLVGTTFAVAAPIAGLAEAGAPVGQGDVFRLTIAAATARNPRNSESDIIELRDGRLLLGWTEFYAGNGADDGAARIVGRVSTDGGARGGTSTRWWRTTASATSWRSTSCASAAAASRCSTCRRTSRSEALKRPTAASCCGRRRTRAGPSARPGSSPARSGTSRRRPGAPCV